MLLFRGRVYVPNYLPIRAELLCVYYDYKLAGYLGISKSIKLLIYSYFWESLLKDMKMYVNTYAVCQ